MEYGEPSEEELKSYTDTAREFKFDLGWLSASKFQEVVYHAVPLTSGKSDFYHDNIAELRKKSRKFRAVLLLSEQASKMDLRTSDPTHQDLVERLTNGPDGGQNELVLAQQFATVAVKVLVENLEIIAPNDIDAEVMAGTSNGTLDGAADAGKSGDKARKEKKKMISKADYQKLDQYLAHLRFKQDKQPNEKNKPNKPEDTSSFADFLKVCERIYSHSAYAPCDKAPKSADALSAEISSLDSNAKVATSSSDPSTQTYQSTQTESTGTPDAAEEGMDVDTFIRDVLQPYLCGQSASDVAKVTDVCTEQWEKAARMQIESQMPNEYELKADSAK